MEADATKMQVRDDMLAHLRGIHTRLNIRATLVREDIQEFTGHCPNLTDKASPKQISILREETALALSALDEFERAMNAITAASYPL